MYSGTAEWPQKFSRIPEGHIKGSVAGDRYDFMVFIIIGFSQVKARRKEVVELMRFGVLLEVSIKIQTGRK